ncbi:MAG: metallo-mystery pair system four-Cys motif protein [Cyanobacteria bacterium CRU_2_1]|nr:metallo-mystery pair system four-Cys motif protein [Cyanobacteria bacterium RU_5_0]NJR62047.1 metallo-mystery pair system four-Cys motif protein [Cyanobacteria bacterium CRU_2_1]
MSSWTQASAADTQAVTLRFQARVADQPFRCDQYYGLGTPASQVAPLDFRFYVSDVALIDANGNTVPLTLEQDGRWQYRTIALLDFEDKSGGCANGTVEMNDRIIGTIPAGDYIGLQFTLGVPFELNHADATLAASPLNLTSLWWNWQFGYKFARIDFSNQHQMGFVPIHSPSPDSSTSEHGDENNIGFAIHLGSTGCEMTDGSLSPTSCSNPNRATVTLSEFDPTTSVVVADLAALVANTDLSINQPNTAPGCMSQPNDRDCVGIMSALGIPFDGTTAVRQTFFRVE